MQGVLDLPAGIRADAVPCLGRELIGVPGQGEGEFVLPRRQFLQLSAVEIAVGLPQRLAEPQQPFGLLGLPSYQQVSGPGRKRGSAQAADLLGEFPVARRAGGLGPCVPDGGEVTRRQSVELIGDRVQVHPDLPHPLMSILS
ncbi:hypothetical protein [Streptomyces sp. C8S0]|uniref:hypothetical protein n=1 Tax=Streptomyces sp. C8S0 TaxID=2585716 RepID=UPI001868C1B8|nr:hypothetical protein [Streptomyces sp. C8S0]